MRKEGITTALGPTCAHGPGPRGHFRFGNKGDSFRKDIRLEVHLIIP